jgi:hypothetical protein
MPQPIDELFSPTYDFSLLYTTDPTMATHKGEDKMPVQGGFIVMQPSVVDYTNLIDIVMNTEFYKGTYCLSLALSACLLLCLTVCLPTCLRLYLYHSLTVSLPVCLPTSLSLSLSHYLPVCLQGVRGTAPKSAGSGAA